MPYPPDSLLPLLFYVSHISHIFCRFTTILLGCDIHAWCCTWVTLAVMSLCLSRVGGGRRSCSIFRRFSPKYYTLNASLSYHLTGWQNMARDVSGGQNCLQHVPMTPHPATPQVMPHAGHSTFCGHFTPPPTITLPFPCLHPLPNEGRHRAVLIPSHTLLLLKYRHPSYRRLVASKTPHTATTGSSSLLLLKN